jgi:hypothetical protein
VIEFLEQQKKLTTNQWKLICTANVADLDHSLGQRRGDIANQKEISCTFSTRIMFVRRHTVSSLTANSAMLSYESFPGSLTADLWIMRFEPTRFRLANSSIGDLGENEQTSETSGEIHVKLLPAYQRAT